LTIWLNFHTIKYKYVHSTKEKIMKNSSWIVVFMFSCFYVFMFNGCSIIKKQCEAPPGPCDIADWQTHCKQSIDDLDWLRAHYFNNTYCFCQDLKTTAIIVSDECLQLADKAETERDKREYLVTAGHLILYYAFDECDKLGSVVYDRLTKAKLHKQAKQFAKECKIAHYQLSEEELP
jgi:hypothetical protein